MTRHYRQFHVAAELIPGHEVALPEPLQHRLRHVLRLGAGDEVHLFSGIADEGVYLATIADAKCRRAVIGRQVRPPQGLKPLELFLGLPKREAFETILRQATELGVTAIHPLFTEATVPTRLNLERSHALIVEAAEQCERTQLPVLHAPQSLQPALAAWQREHPAAHLYWADESGSGKSILAAPQASHVAMLMGPEGGFMPEEHEWLANLPRVTAFTLGQTILRTDTAAIAGLALIKSIQK